MENLKIYDFPYGSNLHFPYLIFVLPAAIKCKEPIKVLFLIKEVLMKKVRVRVDSRNRICLTKVSKQITTQFFAYEEQGRIILEPLFEVSFEDTWLFSPQNKEYLDHLKKKYNKKTEQ